MGPEAGGTRGRRWWRAAFSWAVAIGGVGAATAWYGQSAAVNGAVEAVYRMAPMGSAVAGHRIESFDGGSRPLSDLRGKPVLLDFWASWCPPCRLSMPELERLAIASRGELHVIAVNAFEDREVARAYAREGGLKLDFAFAPELVEALGISRIPAKVLLDGDGRVVWVSTGHVPLLTHAFLQARLAGVD